MDGLLHFDLSQGLQLLAQTPTPPVVPSAPVPPTTEMELLKSQIELLIQTNENLSQSFTHFINAMKYVLAALAVLGGFATYLFGKSLQDARKLASDIVRQEVEGSIAHRVRDAVNDEMDAVKRLLSRERVISRTSVDYCVPAQIDRPPDEFSFLSARGFKRPQFYNEKDFSRLSGAVVVLDIVNSGVLSGPEWEVLLQDRVANEAEIRRLQEQRVADELDRLLQQLAERSVVVVYVRPVLGGRIKALDNLSSQVKYYASANTPVNLVGVVADAAYVADGWRQLN